MDETEFWELIDATREAAEGDPEEQADLLVERLLQLDPDMVLDFARHFEARYNRAFTWDLWGAAWVLLGGASDDAFDYFRCWLIGQGREVYEGAVHDPDALAELLEEFDEELDGDGEDLGYAADEAYEQLTGTVARTWASPPPRGTAGHPPRPGGRPGAGGASPAPVGAVRRRLGAVLEGGGALPDLREAGAEGGARAAGLVALVVTGDGRQGGRGTGGVPAEAVAGDQADGGTRIGSRGAQLPRGQGGDGVGQRPGHGDPAVKVPSAATPVVRWLKPWVWAPVTARSTPPARPS